MSFVDGEFFGTVNPLCIEGCGGFTDVVRSTDGASWTTEHTGMDVPLGRIVGKNGVLVSPGWTIQRSTDGVHWSKANSIAHAITLGPQGFVGVGPGVTTRSADGISWTETKIEP